MTPRPPASLRRGQRAPVALRLTSGPRTRTWTCQWGLSRLVTEASCVRIRGVAGWASQWVASLPSRLRLCQRQEHGLVLLHLFSPFRTPTRDAISRAASLALALGQMGFGTYVRGSGCCNQCGVGTYFGMYKAQPPRTVVRSVHVGTLSLFLTLFFFTWALR